MSEDLLPEAPTIIALATGWDAVRLEVTFGQLTDDVEIYRVAPFPVLLGAMFSSGVLFDTTATPGVENRYYAVASNVEGQTDGEEVSVTTFTQAIQVIASGSPIVIPFTVGMGGQLNSIKAMLGYIVRAESGIDKVTTFNIAVRNNASVVIASALFTRDTLINGGIEAVLILSPAPYGPQTITVTITPTFTAVNGDIVGALWAIEGDATFTSGVCTRLVIGTRPAALTISECEDTGPLTLAGAIGMKRYTYGDAVPIRAKFWHENGALAVPTSVVFRAYSEDMVQIATHNIPLSQINGDSEYFTDYVLPNEGKYIYISVTAMINNLPQVIRKRLQIAFAPVGSSGGYVHGAH